MASNDSRDIESPSESEEDTSFRLEALRWIHDAFADLDRAIEEGRSDTASRLLHRIEDVLHAPAAPSNWKDEH